MKLGRYITHSLLIFVALSFIIQGVSNPNKGWYRPIKKSIENLFPEDTIKRVKSRRPTNTPEDRLGDPYNNNTNSPLQLKNPDNIQEQVELDTATGDYIVKEKIGDMDYRPETNMTFEEFYRYKNQEMIRSYWREKSNDTSHANPAQKKQSGPYSLKIPVRGLEGPFGSNFVDIRPNGLVTLNFAMKYQRVNNPQLPIKQQKIGNFDFDQQISMNVVGKIGEKLKLTVNWDTKAAFEFQNSVKVQYTAFEEDIIQAIEVGRISMPLNSSLMTGPQNLFGFKTKLQFGRLAVTSVVARQDGKIDELKISGGGQGRNFEMRADGYEDYRHFFLSQFFRDRFEQSMSTLPYINSNVRITRVEAYVTNRNNTTTGLRNAVGYLDLGENTSDIFRPAYIDPSQSVNAAASNNANTVFNQVKNYRSDVTLVNDLTSIGMENGTDYSYLKSARKLTDNDFTFNEQLGYITLQSRLRNDEALFVAFEYMYNGQTYRVGELTEDYQSYPSTDLIVLKMLKPPVIKTRLPTWDLMMKNIYQLGTTQLTRDNFQFRVIYKDDISGADIPNLQEGTNTKDVPLLQLCGLDSLNPNNDPAPDGNFDYIEGVTIDAKNGRVIFPRLEPFGSNLQKFFTASEQDLVNKYVFTELYDSTQSDAQQIASKNKYFFKGRYNAGTSNEIILPGINIAPNSVTVIAGSVTLVEGTDYTVDYSLGRIKILNEGVLASGQEIRIRFEKQDLFNFRRKSFIGTRLDYKVNNNIMFGGTFLHSNEAPSISRVMIGDEPPSNTVWGLDANIKQDSRMLTRLVDMLPMIQTKATSNINFQGEFAHFIPGYNKIVDRNGAEGGTAYIDDFEGSKTPYDLTKTPLKWRMSSTPKRFGESDSTSLAYSYRRARLAWYNIDNIFYRSNNGLPSYLDAGKIANHFERSITQQELYPNQDRNIAVTNITSLDLAYYPSEKGSNNYNTDLNVDGTLKNPTNNWAGITRDIRNDIDFDNSNIQYVEFWLMSPYVSIPGGNASYGHTNIDGKPFDVNTKGKMYINLGSISEDVLKDEKQAFENGLPVNDAQLPTNTDNTIWGRVTNQQFLTDAFDNTADSRPKQDIGLDGLNDGDETVYFQNYVNAINGNATIDPNSKAVLLSDVSKDNFVHYLSETYDGSSASILQRYKYYNGTQGNSPLNNGGTFTPSNTNYPDNEDLNGDNTLSTLDEYYEYEIDIDPSQFNVGENYIVSARPYDVSFNDGSPSKETVMWYQFRVPIRTPDKVVGNIDGFKSIKFMRVYMTGFDQPIILRMAQFQLVSNQWRIYQPNDINEKGTNVGIEPDPSIIEVSTVNIEENGISDGNSTPYVLPPGFIRDQDATSTVNRRLNEQSLRLCIEDLKDGSNRAVYKNINFNLINYKKVEMFIHAESQQNIPDGKAKAFLRLGTDYKDNYYEIEVPLHFTNPRNSSDENQVWRSENTIDVVINELINTKLERNAAGASFATPFYKDYNGMRLVVVGNPDLSAVVTVMLGLRNPVDDAQKLSLCIWANELRVTGYVDKASYAYASKINLKLADFANVAGSLRFTSAGFGSLDQKASQRERNNTLEYGVNTTMNLDKFLPEKIGLKLPMYLGYNRKVVSPKYDPLNPDVGIKESINNAKDPDGYKDLILDQTTQKAINFTNIQKIKTGKSPKTHIYDIENLTLSLGYNETRRTSYDINEYYLKNYNGALGYSYNNTAKSHQPFKKMADSKNPFNQLLKEFNFALMPSQITFKGSLDRRITKTQYYQAGPLTPAQTPFYEKSFWFNRDYGLLWNFTKSVTIDYKGTARAIIDEPLGDPSTKQYKDEVHANLKKFGRLKNYDHTIGVNYKIPLDKIKMLNWMSADYRYTGGYGWASGALGQRDTLGNNLSNKRDNSLNGKIDLEKLYSKSKFLSSLKNIPPKTSDNQKNPNDTTKPKPAYRGLKTLGNSMLMVKNLNFTYTLAEATTLAGFTPIAKVFGIQDETAIGDMMPFVLGSQDPNFRYKAAENGWMSRSRVLNTPYTQTYTQNITVRANIEPSKSLKIQLDAKRSSTSKYSELFRLDTLGQDYESFNPLRTGTYSVSYISILSAFDKPVDGSLDPNSSSNFERFSRYRQTIINRQGSSNLDGKSQDALIPAFLAAYSGKDPNKVDLSGFPKMPLPNWRIDFTGLSKLGFLKEKFQTITLSHAYSSQYSTGTYTSSLKYQSDYIRPGNDFLNPGLGDSLNTSGTLIPLYVINEVSIRESFSPLIGFDARTKNRMTYRFEYRRSRNLILGLNNGQMREDISNDYVFGIGFARSNVKIPSIFTGGVKKYLKNELNMRLDLTIRDQISYQRRFDENATITAGNWNFQLKPTVTYNINQRVSLQFYFERTINQPKLSSSFRRSTTSFGVQLRFTLS